MALKPWQLPGPSPAKSHPALEDAIERAWGGRRGPATEDDRPVPSTLPMTKAARAALRLSRDRVAEHTPAVRPSQTHPSPSRSCPYCGRPLRGAARTCRGCDDLPALEPLNEWA